MVNTSTAGPTSKDAARRLQAGTAIADPISIFFGLLHDQYPDRVGAAQHSLCLLASPKFRFMIADANTLVNFGFVPVSQVAALV